MEPQVTAPPRVVASPDTKAVYFILHEGNASLVTPTWRSAQDRDVSAIPENSSTIDECVCIT